MESFYSNGKLLLTGEYVVLDGAISLAVPTKFGQNLTVKSIKDPVLIWKSFSVEGSCWFEAVFSLPKINLIQATFDSEKEGNDDFIAEKLQLVLREAKKLNPDFLTNDTGYSVKTTLTFAQNWGLGSSSTLVNNMATWAKIDAYQLLWNTFGGSGYDIACAKVQTPILYRLAHNLPTVQEVNFKPVFSDALFFVHLNKKQNTSAGIAQYRKNCRETNKEIAEISILSKEFKNARSVKNIEKIITTHEKIISTIIKQPPVKQQLFPDYFGEIKSLGAWGGDFILATGDQTTPNYFIQKGFKTVIQYKDMVF